MKDYRYHKQGINQYYSTFQLNTEDKPYSYYTLIKEQSKDCMVLTPDRFLIEFLIKKEKTTIEKLAAVLGLTRMALSNKIYGKVSFTAIEIRILCEELHINRNNMNTIFFRNGWFNLEGIEELNSDKSFMFFNYLAYNATYLKYVDNCIETAYQSGKIDSENALRLRTPSDNWFVRDVEDIDIVSMNKEFPKKVSTKYVYRPGEFSKIISDFYSWDECKNNPYIIFLAEFEHYLNVVYKTSLLVYYEISVLGIRCKI